MKSSAPGKIILFGEHAVVYGRPALAVPVAQVSVEVEARESNRPGVWIYAPKIGLRAELRELPPDHPIGSVVTNVFATLNLPLPTDGLEINIHSTIPVAAGLGSGAAVSVALTRALAKFLQRSLSDEEVNRLVYEIEKLYHGTPSGIDNTVITYAKPVYFIKGKPGETFSVGKPFTLVIGDTGIQALTREAVADVRRQWLKDTSRFEGLFNEIAQLSLIARRSIESGRPDMLGELMDHNHWLLQEMNVSSPELDRLVHAARDAGANGAKLSGGGRGGNMIALAEKEKAEAVSQALLAAGAKQTLITEVK